METYGAHDTDESNLKDAYETGWWAKEGQSIQYTIPLEKGSYKVEFGFKEWWKDYNSSRQMKVSMVQGETKTELGTTNTWNGGNWWNDAEYEITCETAGDVTFEIAKNGDLDPVLSFITIQKVLDTEALKAVLAQAAQIDRSQYSAKKLKVLDQTVEEGHPLLYKAEATQKLIEEATDKIQTALDAFEADTGIELTQEEIEANDYVLYTVNCGTPDVSVLPNPESERMGLLQSSFDQPYGEDKEKETTWGLNPENEFSKAEKYQANATDIGDSFIYMSENVTFDKDKSTLGYSLEVPDTMEGMEEDTYEVTVAFKLPNWDKRVVNVMLEGSTVATDVSLEQNSWVSRTFTTKVTDGELNVLVKAPRRTSTKQDPILNYIKVRAVKDTEPVIPNYTSFTGVAGETMYDTNGNQIQAHGGQIQKLTVDGVTKWYWIGEDKTNDYRPCGGIHMYSSEDLYNWKDEGVVLKTMESMEQFESDPYFKELYGNETQEQKEEVFVDLDKNNCVMERPKMLYNEKTDKYVIWFHADGRYPGSDADYGKAKAGVAIGDSPTGPFKLLGSYKLDYDKSENPNYGYDGWEGRGSVRDMNLFKDDDGQAYVIYSSEGNETTYISKLNEEYTALAVSPEESVEGVDYTRNFAGWSREAPAMFKYRDKYYIINSGCTGWSPNPAQYFVGDSPMGPFEAMGDPCTDWGSGTTYDTQSTCVIPVDPENGKYIYMGDRWNAGDLSESRYVWLPIEFQPDNKIALRRYENWALEELEGKGLFEVKTELPKTVSSIAEIGELLPSEVTICYGTEDEKTPVTWNVGTYDEDKLGTVTVTGTLTEKDRTFTHEIHVVDEKIKYFFDSAAEESVYYDYAKEVLGNKLQNNKPDQKYTSENHAGYTGITKQENGENFDLGIHEGRNYIETGWWAAANKNIEYAFDVKPGEYTVSAGFQEWWNTTRQMKMTISMGDTVLEEQAFTLQNDSSDLQINQKFIVETEGTVKVTVSKTGNSDPVLSWIALLGEEAEPEPSVDKTNLESLIAYAESQKESEAYEDVVDVVKTLFEKTLAHAKAVMADEKAEQAAVDAAYEALLVNVHLLGFTGNTDDLELALELAKTTNTEGKTPESVQVLKDAIAKAEELIEDGNVLQEEIDAATEALLKAIGGLQDIVLADKTKLKDLLKDSQKYVDKIDQYTKVTADAFAAARDSAQAVYDDPQAAQEQVNTAYDVLLQAIFGLREIPDKSKLEELLKEAQVIDLAKYTEETAATFRTALAKAETVFENENASDTDVKEAEKMLRAAFDGLQKKKVVENPNPNEKSEAARTGDRMPIAGWLIAMAAAATILFVKRKRSKN